MAIKTTPVVLVPVERTQHVDRNITITEKRAPTDDSVRLLQEMQAKAEAALVNSMHVGDTVFECIVHHWVDAFNDEHRWRAVFKLNGKTMTAETAVHGSGATDPVVAFAKLQGEMAMVIAAEVLAAAFAKICRTKGV